MNFYKQLSKRIFDVFIVILLLPIWVPVLGLLSLFILASMGRPVFFIQQRPGFHGKIFALLKLRTMNLGSESDSKRLTRVGAFLRSTSLDELPSLWNILKGDMSLVGQRPLLVQYLQCYTKEQMLRHNVKPGLTGLVQVNGRNLLSWDEKFDLDLEYVQKISFRLDLLILLKTLSRVLLRHGISAQNSVTMPEFTGQSGC
ncbi:MAG: sugar transferase [Myxococcaceae bacterium]